MTYIENDRITFWHVRMITSLYGASFERKTPSSSKKGRMENILHALTVSFR